MKKKIIMIGLVLFLIGEMAWADPQDWGPPSGSPTIDAWRAAGRQNDRERWQSGDLRGYSQVDPRWREYWDAQDGYCRGWSGYYNYGYYYNSSAYYGYVVPSKTAPLAILGAGIGALAREWPLAVIGGALGWLIGQEIDEYKASRARESATWYYDSYGNRQWQVYGSEIRTRPEGPLQKPLE